MGYTDILKWKKNTKILWFIYNKKKVKTVIMKMLNGNNNRLMTKLKFYIVNCDVKIKNMD